MRAYETLADAQNKQLGSTAHKTARVEHVHVHEGGQAIVGTVGPTGGE